MVNKSATIVGIWGFIVAAFFSHLPASRVYGLEESIQAGGSNAKAVHQLGQTGQNQGQENCQAQTGSDFSGAMGEKEQPKQERMNPENPARGMRNFDQGK